MTATLKIKILAALILVGSPFFLPLERVESPLVAAAIIWPFVWPVPLLVYEMFGRNALLKETVKIVGIVLCLLAGYFIYAIAVFMNVSGAANLSWHTWISIAVIGLYFLASFAEMAGSVTSNYGKIKNL